MRKLVIFLLLLCGIVSYGFSQSITFSFGPSFSSMTSKNEILDENVLNFSAFVGMNYLEKKYYFLSSEVGYIKIGGKETNMEFDFQRLAFNEQWNCMQLNTVFNFKYNLNKAFIYCGVGPKVDIVMGDKEFKNDYFKKTDYHVEKYNWGAKFDLGFQHDMNRINMGIKGSYILNFTQFASSPEMNLYSRAFLFNFILSYKI